MTPDPSPYRSAFEALASDQFTDSDIVVLNHEVHFEDGNIVREKTVQYVNLRPIGADRMNYREAVETALRDYMLLPLPDAEDTGWKDAYDGDIFTVKGTLIRYFGQISFSLVPADEGWVLEAVHHGMDQSVGVPDSVMSAVVENQEQAEEIIPGFATALLARAIDVALRVR